MPNPIPSTDVTDFLDNVKDFDALCNQTAGTYVDRFGNTRLTVAEYFRRNGYEVPVAFASGISVSRVTQTVTYSGVTYHALATAIPFTTTGTFNSAQWEVISGVSRQELGAEYGGSLIGAATYAQLRAYSGDALRMQVGGRANYFDGAAGVFIRTGSAADNDGTVIKDALNRSWVRQYAGDINVMWFGADRTAVNDSYPATQAAIDYAATAGGMVHAPAGQYLWLDMPVMKSGVGLRGDGYWQGTDSAKEGVTSFLCQHTSAAMLSLKGAIGVTIENFSLQGSQTAKPKTGLMLGRSSAASAGQHSIRNISITGWFTIAAIYSIASEDNVWSNVFTWNFGGDALYGFVTSTQDIFSVGGLYESTNLNNTITGLRIINTSPSASAAGILMECAESMGSWTITGGYLTQYAGAYVRINSGEIDGKAPFGPINLEVRGEPLAGGNPLYGFDITATVPVNFAGLTLKSSRMQLAAGADHYDIRQSTNVTLLNPDINIQPPEAFPYATSEVHWNKIKGGTVCVGRNYEWKAATLEAGWSNTYGSPYAQASYLVTPDGTVKMRGTVTGGTGAIWTIPTDLIPAVNMHINCGAARLLINSSTGQITFVSGSAAEVDLTSVSYRII